MNKFEPEFVIVGGGLVGATLAYGLVRSGPQVCVLDEGDVALRASRGNFGLVWVQSKGLGMPEYGAWTQKSARDWKKLATLLRDETDIDVGLKQDGGLSLFIDEKQRETRVDRITRLQCQPGFPRFPFEVLDHDETKRLLPDIGKDVLGALYTTLDGHVNPLRLYRALYAALCGRGAEYRPGHVVDAITPMGGGFRIDGPWGEIRAPNVVLAAGLGNVRLAPMVGLEAPVKPERGHIIVTERTTPFLDYPVGTVRQTDEGGVMIGESKDEADIDSVVRMPILSVLAERAVKMFPRLKTLNVVRTWSALRIKSPDGFPVYDHSITHPGAFLATCHSGVTLAAVHALTLGPAIAATGSLPGDALVFSPRRFHVPSSA